MRDTIKMILAVLLVFICVVVVDTIQARVLKNSPVISWKEELYDDSFVARGIVMDTYYCVKDGDIITVSWEIKGSKFTCPRY